MKRSTNLDELDAFALADAVLAELGSPSDAEITAGERELRDAQPTIADDIAAMFDDLDAGDDLAQLLDELDSPDARARELDAINTRRERVIRRMLGGAR